MLLTVAVEVVADSGYTSGSGNEEHIVPLEDGTKFR